MALSTTDAAMALSTNGHTIRIVQIAFAEDICDITLAVSARRSRWTAVRRCRLYYSSLPKAIKNPYILPKKLHVVGTLINSFNIIHLHSDPQLTRPLLSQKYWILSTMSMGVIRCRIFKYLSCFNHKPKNTASLMGDLPISSFLALPGLWTLKFIIYFLLLLRIFYS